MTRARLIILTRFTAFALLAWLAGDASVLLPVGLMMPPILLGGGGVSCGCGSTSSPAGTTKTITVAGVVNGSCSSCGSYNASYVVTCCSLTPGGTLIDGFCGPWWTASPTTTGCTGDDYPRFNLGASGGFPVFDIGAFNMAWGDSSCSGTLTPTFSSSVCDNSGSTITI